ncbi:hypothetical protein ACH5RR_031625 [Cinchona calisaya]|uniref:Uncharacterized protein n=1 Tax=Cinchona calisaya TaxID=153742 RepID=A0ABD2YGU7_9GENT
MARQCNGGGKEERGDYWQKEDVYVQIQGRNYNSGQWTMYEYDREMEGDGNDYDYDVVVCKIKVDYSKSSKCGRLVSRRSHINSTKYLSMESTSSLDRADLDDGSVNSLCRKRPPCSV